MAILEKPTMGLVTGKFGAAVYRRVNGKIVISTYVEHPKVSQTKESKQNRGGFGTLNTMVKAICKIPVLKSLWRTPAGNNITANFQRANRKLEGDNYCIKDLILSPSEKYFPLTLTDFTINDSKISMSVEGFTQIPGIYDYLYFSAQGVIQVFSEDLEKPGYLAICSKDEDYTGNPAVFNFMISSGEAQLLKESSRKNFLVNVIFKNNILKPTIISETIYLEY